jgi:hypothetical protein
MALSVLDGTGLSMELSSIFEQEPGEVCNHCPLNGETIIIPDGVEQLFSRDDLAGALICFAVAGLVR